MNQIIINRILESFQELDRALTSARKTLEKYDNPDPKVIARLSQYEDILEKQRSLATALCGYASLNDWDQVARHVRLINSLSVMIRDDARDLIIGEHTLPMPAESRELRYM